MTAHAERSTVGATDGTGRGGLLVSGRALSAAALLAMGGIHLYLVLTGFDGLIGTLFVLNAIGGLVLAVAVAAAPRRILPVAALLGLLFLVGTLLGLVVSLTPAGLLGVHEQLGNNLVVPTLVVESLGTVVLLATTVLAFRVHGRH
jgi:hypothetical protein